ncbi:PREDICTED: F-box/LRR-repeat protein At2g43260-like [Camelina sativa]|uniref:F-box/LRR-repeat protein At2g43260-like n=1 Tax=Camelina sativa TaxID=90675 RepID=A0ABM0SLE7_CAMSA|nr:PREDICTED: F-box/LRR-repeat protein At2g43260-like [Camelina sativa]
MIDLVPDLVEEILVRLPFKSILKFKTVSKQWRSILESRSFAESRPTFMNKVQKKPQILAAAVNHCTFTMLGDEEGVELVYLHCHVATRPSLACDGLVCIPEPGWINVFNPSTGEFIRFPSGPDPVKTQRYNNLFSDIFPGHWRMGFGRDKVNGSYKVVRMFFEPNHYGEILDLNIGEWRKLPRPPPHHVGETSNSACVNGSIYWLCEAAYHEYRILALDLHTQEFRDVPTPPLLRQTVMQTERLANLEDRLVLSIFKPQRVVEIWCMDTQEETWIITYSFDFYRVSVYRNPWNSSHMWFMPMAVSKGGNLFLHEHRKQLVKYYPKTGCHISTNICVISPFVENLLPLQRPASAPEIRTYLYRKQVQESRISKRFRHIEWWIPNILITITVAATILHRIVHY